MIKTTRAVLEQVKPEDFDDVKKLYKSSEVRAYLGGVVIDEFCESKLLEMVEAKVSAHYFVVRHEGDGVFIGLVSLDAYHDGKRTEVSYQLMPQWWRRGYGSECVRAVLEFGFNELAFNELALEQIVAETQVANSASCRMLEKLGMKLESTVERFGALQAVYYLQRNEDAS